MSRALPLYEPARRDHNVNKHIAREPEKIRKKKQNKMFREKRKELEQNELWQVSKNDLKIWKE